MKCHNCHSKIQRPGDYCLKCNSKNSDIIGIYSNDKIHLFCFYEKEFIGTEIVNPIKHTNNGKKSQIAKRNTMELVSEVIHRKRPKKIIAHGIQAQALEKLWNTKIKFLENIESSKKFKKLVKKHIKEEKDLDRIEIKPIKKIGGKHSTIIGGKKIMNIIKLFGKSPFVKKIVPGPIEASASSRRSDKSYRIQRTDPRGNIKAIVRKGSTIQEIRLITTAKDKKTGKRIIKHLKKIMNKK